jgi:hypothetical protein
MIRGFVYLALLVGLGAMALDTLAFAVIEFDGYKDMHKSRFPGLELLSATFMLSLLFFGSLKQFVAQPVVALCLSVMAFSVRLLPGVRYEMFVWDVLPTVCFGVSILAVLETHRARRMKMPRIPSDTEGRDQR